MRRRRKKTRTVAERKPAPAERVAGRKGKPERAEPTPDCRAKRKRGSVFWSELDDGNFATARGGPIIHVRTNFGRSRAKPASGLQKPRSRQEPATHDPGAQTARSRRKRAKSDPVGKKPPSRQESAKPHPDLDGELRQRQKERWRSWHRECHARGLVAWDRRPARPLLVGDGVDHPTYGVGLVLELRGPRGFMVLFEHGVKMLQER